MSDKKSLNQSLINKPKRPVTVGGTASTSRAKPPSSALKEKNAVSRSKLTRIGEGDVSTVKQEVSVPDFDTEFREIAYGNFLRAMLEDCLVDEKIEREETQMDIQMAQLADRLQNTITQLDKTNRRVKDISFVVEQQRLLDLKSMDTDKFFNATESSKTKELLNDLNATEQESINKLATKNVDFGYNPMSGHNQLLEAVNEALDGLESIKSHSKLDLNKFQEYVKSQKSLEDLEKERFDLESIKSEFESRFPKFSEKVFKEASDLIANALDVERNNDVIEVSDDSDD